MYNECQALFVYFCVILDGESFYPFFVVNRSRQETFKNDSDRFWTKKFRKCEFGLLVNCFKNKFLTFPRFVSIWHQTFWDTNKKKVW